MVVLQFLVHSDADPLYQASGSALVELAVMSRNGALDAVIADSDETLLLGARTVIWK